MIEKGDMPKIEGVGVQRMKGAFLQGALDGLVHVPSLQAVFLRILRRVVHRAIDVLTRSLTPYLIYLGACTERTVTGKKNGTRGRFRHLRPRPGNGAHDSAAEKDHIKPSPILPCQGTRGVDAERSFRDKLLSPVNSVTLASSGTTSSGSNVVCMIFLSALMPRTAMPNSLALPIPATWLTQRRRKFDRATMR